MSLYILLQDEKMRYQVEYVNLGAIKWEASLIHRDTGEIQAVHVATKEAAFDIFPEEYSLQQIADKLTAWEVERRQVYKPGLSDTLWYL